jgi:hypothetical protein
MAVYAIRLRGHIGPEWSEWLDGLAIRHEGNGETVLSGPVADQAALFGLLARIRDLGLPLLAVTEVTAPNGEGGDDERRRRRDGAPASTDSLGLRYGRDN